MGAADGTGRMVSGVKWKRVQSNQWDGSGVGSVYEAGVWTLRQEFYADGPSLFTWMLYRGGPNPAVLEFPTKRAATTYVERRAARGTAA